MSPGRLPFHQAAPVGTSREEDGMMFGLHAERADAQIEPATAVKVERVESECEA